MKSFFGILFCTVLIFCGYLSATAEETLKIAADDDFPPFSFSENGKSAGIDIDILKELGKRIDINFQISLLPWKRLLIKTQKGSYDGSMSLFKTGERKKYAIFTHPIHYSTFVLFVKKGNEFKFTSIKDLYGKSIMKQAGFSIEDNFDQAVKEKKINSYDIFESTDVFRFILNETHDAFLGNLEVTLHKLKNQPDFIRYVDKITYLPKPIKIKHGAFFVLSKNSGLNGKKELAKKITENLSKMENDGTFLKIMSKYIEKADYQHKVYDYQ